MNRFDDESPSVLRRLGLLRRRYAFWASVTLLAHWALVLGALVLAALLLIDRVGDGTRVWFAIMGVGGLLGAVYLCRASLGELFDLRRFARYLQRNIPDTRQNFEIALAFEESLPSEPVQRTLALRHCAQALEELQSIPRAVITEPRRRRLELAAVLVWALVPLLALASGIGFQDFRHAWFQWDGLAAAGEQGDQPGERFLAEFTFSISPPDYTKLPPEEVTGNGEWLRAYRGSDVLLTLRVQGAPDGAQLRLPDESVVELERANRGFTGTFVVTDEGPFVLLLLRDGEWSEDATQRRMEFVPDEYPTAELLAPEDERVVRPGDAVTLRYEARDDFGISKAELVVDGGSGEKRFPMPFSEVEHFRAEKRFAIREWAQREGTVIRYYVEVMDNDTVSGPKKSRSNVQTIEIFSPRKAHRELLERQDRLFDQVVHVLGDSIDLPESFGESVGPRLETLEVRLRESGTEFESLIAAFGQDEVADPVSIAKLQNLRGRLRTWEVDVKAFGGKLEAGQGAETYSAFRPDGIERMEDITIDFAELIQRDRMNDLLATADEIRRAREELRDLIAAYRENPTPELQDAIRRKLAEIKELMQELARQRSELSESLPDEFVNTDAFQQADGEGASQQIDELERMLESDDLEGLLSQLDAFDDSLSAMLDGLDDAGEGVNQRASAGPERELARLLDEVNELETGQSRLAEAAQEHAERQQAQQSERAREAAAEIEQQMQQLEQQARQLRERAAGNPISRRGFGHQAQQAQQEMQIAREALSSGDWNEAQAAVERAERRFRGLQNFADFERSTGTGGRLADELSQESQQAAEAAGELREQMQDTMQGDADDPDAQSLAEAQQQVRQRLAELQERLDSPDQPIPGSEESREALEGSGQSMEEAGENLQEGRAPEGAMRAEEAAEQLRQVRDQLSQMQQQMEQARSEQRRGREEGDGLRDGEIPPSEKVEIPGITESREDRREQVLEGMREGMPESYRDLNRRYYERLVR